MQFPTADDTAAHEEAHARQDKARELRTIAERLKSMAEELTLEADNLTRGYSYSILDYGDIGKQREWTAELAGSTSSTCRQAVASLIWLARRSYLIGGEPEVDRYEFPLPGYDHTAEITEFHQTAREMLALLGVTDFELTGQVEELQYSEEGEGPPSHRYIGYVCRLTLHLP